MTNGSPPEPTPRDEHQTWILSRLQLDKALQEAMRQGFALIAAGFGSFAIFDGLAPARASDELPKVFALAVTAIGVIVILFAIDHFRRMAVWVNEDAFGPASAPKLPDEDRPVHLATAAALIGIVSFVALLSLR